MFGKAILIFSFVLVPSGFLMSFLERKLAADFQARVGPNRAGSAGILQPVADFLKCFQKARAKGGDESIAEMTWFLLLEIALFSTLFVLPLGSRALLVETDLSAIFPLGVALALALIHLFWSLSLGSVSSGLGGLRLAAQAVPAAFSALIAFLCAGVEGAGFRWTGFARVQGASPLYWIVFQNPFEFLSFFVFMVSGLVLWSYPPMESGVGELDIRGGVASRLTGSRGLVFRLGRFYGLFLWSIMAVVLFLGAWNLPQGLVTIFSEKNTLWIFQGFELGWLLLKTFGLMLILVWVNQASLKLRVDQITDFTWKVLCPLSLGALIGAILWVEGQSFL